MIICDEPVSSLDLSIQAQILNLFHDLQQELSVSYLFIAHDLFAVQHVSHRILVLYRGRVMESGSADIVFSQPRHPYTRELLAATPVANPKLQRARRAKPKPAGVGIAAHDGDGCPFIGRCPYAVAACMERQALRLTSVGTHAACHRSGELPAWTEAESLAS
jgi:peptide/nickel transport system ATP-binding protein